MYKIVSVFDILVAMATITCTTYQFVPAVTRDILDQELISYCCSSSWGDLFEKAQGSVISIAARLNLAGIFLN